MPRIGEVVYKVCLVEDDPNSRELFVHWMRSCKRLQLVGAYGTGEEALKEVPRIKADVVLMDVKLPGMSGVECVAALRHMSPPCSSCVLILTECEDDNLIVDALKAGADGYLLKRDACGKALGAAIVGVMAGGGPMTPSVAHKVIASFQSHRRETSSSDRASACSTFPLTVREQGILKHATQGLTYKEIASGLNISIDTVRRHFQSIFYKLHVHSRSDPRLYSVSQQYWDRP